MKARYLSLNSRVVHLGDCMIYGISANIVAVEMEYLSVSEGLRDLCGVWGGQIDRAAISGVALAHAANNSHALIGVMNVFGKYFRAVRLRDFKREESVGSDVIEEEGEVLDV